MCPIANLSDLTRIPRLGKIHLGIKVQPPDPGRYPYPKATDFFICPPEAQKVLGEKPKELPIMFPVEDETQFAQQWLRAYSQTQGLTCVGNGVTCRRKIDLEGGAMASHTTREGGWIWKEDGLCDPQECPDYSEKKCRRVMNLMFLIPEVPGLGVWQIDTSSFFSIVNINSIVRLLKELLGRCSMIPLTLALGPVEVTPPGLKKKTVFILHIKKDDLKLADLARLAQLSPVRTLMITQPEVEEPPEDLFPQEVLEASVEEGVGDKPPSPSPTPATPAKEKRDKPPAPQPAAGRVDHPSSNAEMAREIIRGFFKKVGWDDEEIAGWLRPRAKGFSTIEQIPEDCLQQVANEALDWEAML